MFESILFLCSLILLFITFLFIKKNDNRLSIIKWFFIEIILIFCFNSLIVYILSYFHIPSNLTTISVIYILISVFLYLKFVRKQSQKYFFDKKEFIFLIVLSIIVFVISIIRFGIPFSIIYESLDPAVHFQSAYSFYKESFLLNFVTDKTILNFSTWRFASYVNLGMIFKFLSPFMAKNNFYTIYIIYDILTLLTTSILFYYLISNTKNSIIKYLGTILFLLGYPLNNLLLGFFYVGHASCIILTVMIIVRELKFNNIIFVLLFLLNIGLIFTYYLFAPLLFVTEFIYFIKSKQIIVKYLFIFFIPLICWFIYFIIPTFSNGDMNLINQTKIDGYFYNDVLGNSLLFFPIISYYIYHKIKAKQVNFELIMIIVLAFQMIVLHVFVLFDLLMPYYVSKFYYILWIICFVIFFRTYEDYYQENKFVFNNYGLFMLFTIVLTLTNFENKIINVNNYDFNKTTPSMLFNVYAYNMQVLKNPTIVLNSDEISDIKKMSLDIKSDYKTNAEPEQILWLINFFPDAKIECPVNQTYECIKENKYVDIYTYLSSYNFTNLPKSQYIYFFRSMHIYEVNINDEVANAACSMYDNITKYNTAFILEGD